MIRRLPVYLLIDISVSMRGENIVAVQDGISKMVSALNEDPQALETAYLSVITFSDGVEQVVPLTELGEFTCPELVAGGMTSLGQALKFVSECADREVRKNTEFVKGDWRPIVFIMTDGCATDDVDAGVKEFRKRKWGMVVACAAGSAIETRDLSKVTECIVRLNTADAASISSFFKWVSASVSVSSTMVGSNAEIHSMEQMPPPPPDVIFEKVPEAFDFI